MDERVEEVKPISRISPTRKLSFARRRRRELMYQFYRYQKKKATDLAPKKMPDLPKSQEASSHLTSEEVSDIKKRITFDRAIILGD